MTNSSTPSIFEPVFNDDWQDLPIVFKHHYQNKPFSNDATIAKGYLNLITHPLLKILQPFYRILGMPPLVNCSNVPVVVTYQSDLNSAAFKLKRTFDLKNKTTYSFCSSMHHKKNNEVIDVMRFGFSWRIKFVWQGNKIHLKHNGYALKIFNIFLPLPITFLIGRLDAIEYEIDENNFGMSAELKHWLFGQLYSYTGKFEISK